jgi:hypothetical protein
LIGDGEQNVRGLGQCAGEIGGGGCCGAREMVRLYRWRCDEQKRKKTDVEAVMVMVDAGRQELHSFAIVAVKHASNAMTGRYMATTVVSWIQQVSDVLFSSMLVKYQRQQKEIGGFVD